MTFDPWIALAVVAAMAMTDAIYVLWLKQVVAKRPIRAGLLSSLYHMAAAVAVISYTKEWIYVLFAAAGSFVGVYLSTRFGDSSKGS